jgi:glyoxylase-like metal-dependent hydrolase (beta-lactamase superfamily II)
MPDRMPGQVTDQIPDKMPDKLLHLTDKVYYLPPWSPTDRPVLGVIAGRSGCLVVDAGNSPAHAELFRRECGALGLPPLSYLAITHWHWDHVFGAATLGLPTVTHHETALRIREMTAFDWSDEALDERVRTGTEIEFCAEMIKLELTPAQREVLVIAVPDASFERSVEIDLGGVTCIVEHVGGDHDPGSSVVYVPDEEVLFLGDCLGADLYHGPYAYTRAKLFPLIEKVLNYPARWYVEGHGKPLSREEMQERLIPLLTLGELARRYRKSRERIAQRFVQEQGRPLSEDELADLEYFLAGAARRAK